MAESKSLAQEPAFVDEIGTAANSALKPRYEIGIEVEQTVR